jgi:hypothetical protein
MPQISLFVKIGELLEQLHKYPEFRKQFLGSGILSRDKFRATFHVCDNCEVAGLNCSELWENVDIRIQHDPSVCFCK